MKSLSVNVISESVFTVQGHGVHTAYVEHVRALRSIPNIKVAVNKSDGKYDVVHIHTTGLYALKFLLAKGTPKVVSAHILPASLVGSFVWAKYWSPLAKRYLRWFYNQADTVLAVSQDVSRELTRLGVTKPVVAIPNMIDTARFRQTNHASKKLRDSLGIDAKAFVVITIGQIQPRKGLNTFLSVAKRLPDITFVWVGGMPFKQLGAAKHKLTKTMQSAPKNVIFTGIVSLDDMPAYYQIADVFFLPSLQETFGIVVVEAAASKLPIVLRDLAVYKDAFGSTYLKGSNVVEFTKLIKRLSKDRDFYLKSQKASAAVSKMYDVKTVIKDIVTIYQSLDRDKS
jgi:1,2-diacylglycerol-3-alpha-glucose alpha-1,2-galactosyltransferase